MSRIVAYVPDLMDRSRFGSVSAETSFVKSPDELVAGAAEEGVEIVVLDLNRPGSPEVLPRLEGMKVIAFSSHVERDAMRAAAMSSSVQVLARSVFFTKLKIHLSGQ